MWGHKLLAMENLIPIAVDADKLCLNVDQLMNGNWTVADGQGLQPEDVSTITACNMHIWQNIALSLYPARRGA